MTRNLSVRVRPALVVGAFVFAAALSTQAGAEAGGSGGWGTTPGYTTVMGYQLVPMDNFGDATLARSLASTWCHYSAHGLEAAAPIGLPDGVALEQLEFWADDTDPDNWMTFDVFEACQAPGQGGEPTTTLLGEAETFGSPGVYYGTASLGGHTVDNSKCHYSIRVLFVPPGVACVQTALRVYKVRVAWARQVSPPPAVATFNDVATNQPFFQFIEALAKSGITGGCGGGAYCPNQPLTRGQMAVFLAKGLGLVEQP